MKWFNHQSRLIQLILLLIPVVNWFVEIFVRWDAAMKHKDVLHILVAVIYTFFGWGVSYIDLIWCLLFKHLPFAK